MSHEWIEYKGKKILSVDYSHAVTDEEKFAILAKSTEILLASSERVLLLANFTNTKTSQKFFDEIKRTGKEVRNAKVSKTALLGIVGVKLVMVESYILFTGDRKTKPFNNVEDAKNWLVA